MKLPPIHLELHTSGLTGSNSFRYFKTTESSLLRARKLLEQFNEEAGRGPNADQTYDELFDAAQNAVIYSGMCIEATLFDLSLVLFGKSFAEHIDRLDPLGKFFVLVRLLERRDPKSNGITYQALRTVVGERNKLVHSKSLEYASLDDFEPLIDHAEQRGRKLSNGVKFSYRALVLLSMYFDGNIFEELRILPSFKKPEYWQQIVPADLHSEVAWCAEASQRERGGAASDT